MKLKSITARAVEYAFRDGAYVMSHVTQTTLPTRVLTVEAADGSIGYGEVVRMPTLDPEVTALLEDAVLDGLADTPMDGLPALARSSRARDSRLKGFAFGLETAYFDWVGRRAGEPLHALLGGRRLDAVDDYLSLSCASPDAMLAEYRAQDRGNRVIQPKLGIGPIADDIARMEALLTAIGSDHVILADFNGGRTPDEAETVIRAVADPRIVWEEPCDSFADNRTVIDRTGAPVQLDQCLASLASTAEAVAHGGAHSIAIKPAKLGGLSAGQAARDMCDDAGMAYRIDGPWCGHIAAAAVAHLAVTADPGLMMCSCDLRQPLILDGDWGGIRTLDGGRLTLSDSPGHGATPPRA
jgi:L-alanine-DL-glutamate epimerase-like enolase superfamily enzyme